MVTTLTVLNAMRRATVAPCCQPDHCDYSPERVRRFLSTIRALKGECSAREAIRSVHYRTQGYDRERGGGFDSGSASERASQVVVDLVRAIKAGKRTPVEISQFLCPMMPAPVDEPEPVAVS